MRVRDEESAYIVRKKERIHKDKEGYISINNNT